MFSFTHCITGAALNIPPDSSYLIEEKAASKCYYCSQVTTTEEQIAKAEQSEFLQAKNYEILFLIFVFMHHNTFQDWNK